MVGLLVGVCVEVFSVLWSVLWCRCGCQRVFILFHVPSPTLPVGTWSEEAGVRRVVPPSTGGDPFPLVALTVRTEPVVVVRRDHFWSWPVRDTGVNGPTRYLTRYKKLLFFFFRQLSIFLSFLFKVYYEFKPFMNH